MSNDQQVQSDVIKRFHFGSLHQLSIWEHVKGKRFWHTCDFQKNIFSPNEGESGEWKWEPQQYVRSEDWPILSKLLDMAVPVVTARAEQLIERLKALKQERIKNATGSGRSVSESSSASESFTAGTSEQLPF